MPSSDNVIQSIRNRTSCRSFSPQAIEPEKLSLLEDGIRRIEADSPIGARMVLLHAADASADKPVRLGTYGTISGARSYLVGIAPKNEQQAAVFGYQFEQAVLLATSLGLGTCWLGGTFNRRHFAAGTVLADHEHIPIVSPIGYAATRRKLPDTVMRTLAGSNRRKPWDELFFEASPDTRLLPEAAGSYQVPLEMVRLGPSASNKQPWRIIRQDRRFDFFLRRSPGYGVPGFDIQLSDIGVAQCHFEMAARELGLNGQWNQLKGVESIGLEYIASWIEIQD